MPEEYYHEYNDSEEVHRFEQLIVEASVMY